MKFNAKMCEVMGAGKGGRRLTWTLKSGNSAIGKVKEKYPLVVIQDNLHAEKHTDKITREAYKLVTNMSTRPLITSMIRPRVEYPAVLWSLHAKKHI